MSDGEDREGESQKMIFRIGRRTPLAVLTLISGLSSVSLAITLLGTGWINREINLIEEFFFARTYMAGNHFFAPCSWLSSNLLLSLNFIHS